MIKAWLRRKKIFFKIERELPDIDLEIFSDDYLKSEIECRLKSDVIDRISSMEMKSDIDDSVKNLLFEILEDFDFKTGLKGHSQRRNEK